MTAKKKRIGREDAPARKAFLDAAERVLYRDGYAHLNARRIAEEAGLKKQLLFYYFHSMDDLICETFSRCVAEFTENLDSAFASDDPLRALWELQTGGNARLFTEFMAIANHSEVLRAKIAKVNAENNAIQAQALARLFPRLGIDPAVCPPQVALFILSSVTRNLIVERELGLLECGDELEAFVESFLQHLQRGALQKTTEYPENP